MTGNMPKLYAMAAVNFSFSSISLAVFFLPGTLMVHQSIIFRFPPISQNWKGNSDSNSIPGSGL